MAVTLDPVAQRDIAALRRIVTDPSLADQHDVLQAPGALEHAFADPFVDRRLCWIGRVDGTPAGFGVTAVLNSWAGPWAAARIGVVAPARRRRLGSKLLEAMRDGLRALRPECGELCLSAWLPSPDSEAFAAHHGYAPARTFWLMECARAHLREPEWPDGVETRTFDGSDAAFEDWNASYNVSFARHYHGVISSVEVCRSLMRRPESRADGLLLAYRDGRCVGFCRNELFPGRGEIGILGVVPDARGIGLGRALLRWGGRWLDRARAARITLLVDGQNENALGLYRSEGFVVVRTRRIWSRALH